MRQSQSNGVILKTTLVGDRGSARAYRLTVTQRRAFGKVPENVFTRSVEIMTGPKASIRAQTRRLLEALEACFGGQTTECVLYCTYETDNTIHNPTST